MTTETRPKLYVYDNSPLCVRTRTMFGLKQVDHELVFVAYHDPVTPTKLVGVKQTPILQLPSGEAFGEHADIIKYIDENLGGKPILQPASGRSDLAEWQQKAEMDFRRLQIPRAMKSLFPEIAQKKSRDFLLTKQEIFGSYDELYARTPELLVTANAHLVKLESLLFSEHQVNPSGLSFDDLVVFSMLRGLTLVKGVQWPAKVRSYAEYYSKAADVPLLDAMAQ